MSASPLTNEEVAALPTAYGTALGMLEQARAGTGDVVVDVVAGSQVGDLLPLLREGGQWAVAGALGGHGVRIDIRATTGRLQAW